MNILYKNIVFLFFCFSSSIAFASGPGFNDTTNQPLTSGSNPNFSVNVGIGSSVPGQKLDVQGTIRATGFIAGAGGITLGGVNNTSWPAGGSNYWLNTAAAGNVGISTANTVGIGTTSAGAGAGLVVMNGNVGIGTFAPLGALQIVGTGNVGIGSTAPGVPLDVNGKVRMTGFNLSTSPNSGYVLTSDASGNGTWAAASGGGSNYWNYSAAGNIGVSTIQAVGIGTTFVGGTGEAALAVMNGNVGIGTWVPPAQLSISSSNSTILLDSTIIGGTYGGLWMGTNSPSGSNFVFAGDGSNTVFNGGIYGIDFRVNNGYTPNPLHIDSAGNVGIFAGLDASNPANFTVNGGSYFNGNVGIGTITPAGALTVMNGNVGIGTWVPPTLFYVSGPRSAGTNLGQIVMQGLADHAYFQIGSSTPTTKEAGFQLSGIGSFTDPDWTIKTPANSSDLRFNSYNGGAFTDMMTINQAGNVGIGTTIVSNAGLSIMNGNVGIGTWVPNTSLNVLGGATINGAIAPIYATSYGTTRVDINSSAASPNTGFAMLNNGAAAWAAAAYKASGTNLSFTFYNDAFSGGGASALFIDGDSNNIGIGTVTPAGGLVVMNGNVGIGTWVPKGTLDVGATGTICLGGTCNSTWPGGGANYWLNTAAAGNVGISTTNTVGIGTTSGVGAGLVVMNGNVGIGTWVPAAALDFENGNSYTSAISINGTAIYSPLGGEIQMNAYGGLKIDSNQGVIITPGHNVGFTHYGDDSGTTSGFFYFSTDNPVTALNSANGDLISIGIAFAPTSGTYNYSDLLINDTINQSGSTGITRGLFVNPTLTSASDYRAIETAVGNVGIGTISGNLGIGSQWPGQRIDVQGTVRATGLIAGAAGITLGGVNNTSWPAGGSNYWLNTAAAGNVGISTTNTVGIGTTSGVGAGLVVMNGNVGIGTWAPAATLDINGNFRTSGSTSNTTLNATGGNVGIGSANPGMLLDVAGNIRGTQVVDTGVTASSLVYANSSQQLASVTIGSGLTLSGATLSASGGGSNYWLNTAAAGNVGISTTNSVGIGTTSAGAGVGLVVMNGNVGIGTWAPNGALVVNGNVGIGSNTPTFALSVTPASGVTSGQTALFQDATPSTGSTNVVVRGGANDFYNNIFQIQFDNETPSFGVDVYGDTFLDGGLQIGGTLSAGNQTLVITGVGGYGQYAATSGEQQAVSLAVQNGSGFNSSSGNATFDTLAINFLINQTGTATGASRGLYVNPTLTSAADFRAIETAGYTDNLLGTPPTTLEQVLFNAPTLAAGSSTIVTNAATQVITGAPIAGTNVTITNPLALWVQGGKSIFAGNVGIGTTTPTGGLAVMNGNVGIGTWVPGSALQVNNTITFQNQYNIGSQGGGFTINWNNGNKQKVTLTGSTSHTATITAPTNGVTNLLLTVTQGSASNTITWSPSTGSMKWSGGAPTLSAGNGAVDIINCFYDGTNYYCTYSLNFS